MTKSILSDAVEAVTTTRSERKSQRYIQCSEPHFLNKKVALLLDSSYRIEALLETFLVLFAKFADRLLTKRGNNVT